MATRRRDSITTPKACQQHLGRFSQPEEIPWGLYSITSLGWVEQGLAGLCYGCLVQHVHPFHVFSGENTVYTLPFNLLHLALGQQPEAPYKHSSHPKAPHYLPDPSAWAPLLSPEIPWVTACKVSGAKSVAKWTGRKQQPREQCWRQSPPAPGGTLGAHLPSQGRQARGGPAIKSSAGTNFHVQKWTWLPVLAQDLIPTSFQVIQHHLQSIPSPVPPGETSFHFWNANAESLPQVAVFLEH